MERMKQYNGKMGSGIYKYLIEKEGDLELAIGQMIIDYGISLTAHNYGMDDLPKVYPYIVLMHPDDEYNRIDFAFVTITDFSDNEIGTLRALSAALYNDDTMKPWIDRLTEAAQAGEKTVEFDDLDESHNPDNHRAVNDEQINYIRQKGYKVQWEKYPRQYIVSGW